MENISEKPKRGRPPKFSAEYMQSLAALYPDLRSKRGLIETALGMRALGLLQKLYTADKTGNRWVEYYLDPQKRHIFHQTILSALGRIDDDDALITTAKVIATKRFKTADAIKEVRNVRYRMECARDGKIFRALCHIWKR